MLSTTHENVAYRLCQELDFDLLLTGHQHMTVHGQTLCGTFVVQPTDRGQEFLHIEAAISETGKRFTSETIPASGACRREWLDEFAGMERGAQDWLDQVVGHLPQPLMPDTPLHMAAGGSGLPDLFNAVQLWASGAQLSASSLAIAVSQMVSCFFAACWARLPRLPFFFGAADCTCTAAAAAARSSSLACRYCAKPMG